MIRWIVQVALDIYTFERSHRVYRRHNPTVTYRDASGRPMSWGQFRYRVWRKVVTSQRHRGTISLPPGWRLLRAAQWIYSNKTVEQVFLPTIRDMQHEHIEALGHGQQWKGRWVLVRGYWSLWSAALAQAPFSLLKRIVELWKAAS